MTYAVEDQNEENLDTEIVKKSEKWYKKISVEPTIFLYMLATMITSVIEQAFYVHKACTVNHGQSEEICSNLEKYEDINKAVHNLDTEIVKKSEKWYKKISVEPTIFLYMLATMITSVIEQAFYVHKACTVNHGQSEEICSNLEKYEDINKAVHNLDTEIVKKSEKWYKKISVEPTIFLYMLATMITSVIEQAFYVHKACTVNHGQSEEICSNLEKYEDINKAVHITVSTFHQWNSIANRLLCIIIALFLGSWSERRGRKLPLLIGLIGRSIYALMLVVNTLISSWPLEYIVFTATLPTAITGGESAIYACCFSYLTDITTVKQRTKRITIVDISLYATMPIGIALGSYLFTHVFIGSFTIMFIIKASCLILAAIYSFFNLKWLTTSKQQLITEISYLKYVSDFFDYSNVFDSFKMFFRKRSSHKRTYLWLILLCAASFTFLRDERPMLYLYAQFKFHWDTETYSYFKTFQTTMYAVMMLSAFPILSKFFGLKDTTIAILGAICTITSRLIYGFADIGWVFYVGGAVCGLGAIVTTVSRSMLSKLVPLIERGRVFAILGVFDNVMTFISGISYTQVYNATIGKTPGIFWLTCSTQVLIIIIMLGIQISLRGRTLEDESDNVAPSIESVNNIVKEEKGKM